MKPTSAATIIESELIDAPALPPLPTTREMRNGTAIGNTNIVNTQITLAVNAATIPTSALLR